MNEINLLKQNIESQTIQAALASWKSKFEKRMKKSGESSMVQAACSIASQSLESLRSNEKHGYLWVAQKDDEICAVLIGDDKGTNLIIRFLVADVLNPKAKGTGTFLANKMLEFAIENQRTVCTIAENADKFWKNKMGFKPNPKNSIEYIYEPGESSSSSVENVKEKERGKKKKRH
ncbi:MAG TPA: hypothetical protein DCE71_01825 [Parachlamydiales bacterium]|nr:hypothetical protein [Parachlamydiales bacterium]